MTAAGLKHAARTGIKSTGFGDPLNEKWRSRLKRTMALKWNLGISDFIHLDFRDTSKGGTWDLRNSSCDIASAEVITCIRLALDPKP